MPAELAARMVFRRRKLPGGLGNIPAAPGSRGCHPSPAGRGYPPRRWCRPQLHNLQNVQLTTTTEPVLYKPPPKPLPPLPPSPAIWTPTELGMTTAIAPVEGLVEVGAQQVKPKTGEARAQLPLLLAQGTLGAVHRPDVAAGPSASASAAVKAPDPDPRSAQVPPDATTPPRSRAR